MLQFALTPLNPLFFLGPIQYNPGSLSNFQRIRAIFQWLRDLTIELLLDVILLAEQLSQSKAVQREFDGKKGEKCTGLIS
jgi:hypothetical protein